jgi:ribonuclease HI
MEKELHIYCDGACSGNPGPGGWGAVLIWGDNTKEISGSADNTTNNQMELRAAIESIKSVKKKVKIVIHTDSQYVKNGITVWIKSWLKNNWNKGKVKNIELWKELLEESSKHEIVWKWVKGHSGVDYNERADRLATEAVKK